MRELLRHDCPPLERLTALYDGALETAQRGAVQAHLDSCAACQAEWNALAEFAAATPEREETAAVRAIAAHLKAVRAPQPAAGKRSRWFSLPLMTRWAGSLAAVLLVATLGWQWRASQRTSLDDFQPSQQTRAGLGLEIRTQGDLPFIPQQVEWQAVAGAARYEVVFTEVDGSEIWRESSSTAFVPLPETVRAAMLPGRTLHLQIFAQNAAGNSLTQSEVVRFRLMPARTK